MKMVTEVLCQLYVELVNSFDIACCGSLPEDGQHFAPLVSVAENGLWAGLEIEHGRSAKLRIYDPDGSLGPGTEFGRVYLQVNGLKTGTIRDVHNRTSIGEQFLEAFVQKSGGTADQAKIDACESIMERVISLAKDCPKFIKADPSVSSGRPGERSEQDQSVPVDSASSA
ncbi:MAG: hypothetical protein KGI45_01580 [Patescibacteria group bacterium]|nr:hypothetical protein [Patescibacteria group bacterium]